MALITCFPSTAKFTMQQWGVYLTNLRYVRKNTSLCPTHYNGRPINMDCYHAMAAILYECLSWHDVISHYHTSI
jgi:hypothetical protein